MKTLTKPEIDSTFIVDPEKGFIFWKNDRKRLKAGQKAGGLNQAMGYNTVSYDWTLYRVDQIVWTYVTGEIPTEKLIHIDKARSDDRFNNLVLKSDLHFLEDNKITYSPYYNEFVAYNVVNSRNPDKTAEVFTSFAEAKAAWLKFNGHKAS